MFPCTGFFSGFWWIFPVIMLIMMVFCFLMMRSHKGPMMMRGPGSHSSHRPDSRGEDAPGSGIDILNKRYARGEIDRTEYEEKKKEITGRA